MVTVEECIFCKIVAGKIPSYKLYEDDLVYALLDIYPASQGHALVIPKKHYEQIFEIPEETIGEIAKIAKRIAEKQREELDIQGVNLLQSNGKAAQQEIPHFHMHVVPRRTGDSMNLWAGKVKITPNLEETQKKLILANTPKK